MQKIHKIQNVRGFSIFGGPHLKVKQNIDVSPAKASIPISFRNDGS